MSTLFLCGAGNSEGVRLAVRINEASRRWDNIVLLDDDRTKHGSSLVGVKVEGGFDLLKYVSPDDEVQNLVTRTAVRRRNARQRIEMYTSQFASLISPQVDALGATLDHDCTVYHGATLGPETVLGAGSVVWMGAVVGHESTVGSGSIVAPNAVLNARVVLGEGVYIGTNATVLPEVTIGSWATVAAGSVVVGDMPAGATALVVPAEIVARDTSSTSPSPSDRLEGDFVAPRTTAELLVAQVWQEQLGVESVGVHDNFIDLGGHSLLAVQVTARLENVLGVQLNPMHLLFETLGQCAARCEEHQSRLEYEHGSKTPAEKRSAGSKGAMLRLKNAMIARML